jgi:hypothetical protein
MPPKKASKKPTSAGIVIASLMELINSGKDVLGMAI